LLAAGQLQQQQSQAVANLPWLNNQGQQQFALAGLAGQDAATATATPAAGYSTTGSTFAPNNAGWALAGTLGGAILGSAAGPFGGSLGASLGSGITGTGSNPYAAASAGGSSNGSSYPSASWLNNGFGF